MKTCNSIILTPKPFDICAGVSTEVDIKNKILKISLDNPYFSKPIKMIQNLKDVNMCKNSIYNFCSNLNNEDIINGPSNENEKQLPSILFCFISNFNEYLHIPENQKIKKQIFDNGNFQSDLYIQYNHEELSKEYTEFLNDESAKNEDSQEEEETKIKSNDIVNQINELLVLPKFPSITEVKISENDELKNFMEYYSNHECFKETISPILNDNYWQINFPSWAYKIEDLSCKQLIASILEIIITLFYQYYKVANIKISKKEGQKNLNDAIKEIQNKYKSINDYSAFPPLFEIIVKRAFFPPKKLLCNQFEEYLLSHNIKRDEAIDTTEKCEEFIEDILNEVKKEDMITTRKKREEFFEKVTFYNLYDTKENKYNHIVYYYLRDFIMKYIPFRGLIDEINNIVNNLDMMNERINKYKEATLEITKAFIEKILEKNFKLKFVYYGSHCSNLNLPKSDIDFRLFYKEKDETNPVNQDEFIQKLMNVFIIMEKLLYLEVKPLLDANTPLFKLKYKINDTYNNELIIVIVNIDVTFEKYTKDENGENYSEKIIQKRIDHIKNEIDKNPLMRNNILIIKLLLENFGMNSTYEGGISSYILTLLYNNSVKMFKNYFDNNNPGIQLLLFLNKFSKYQYNYYIDKNGKDQFLSHEDKEKYFAGKNQKYRGDKEADKYKRFYVDDPVLIEPSNVADPCYNPEKVKNFFSWLFLEIKDGNNITQILKGNFLYPNIGLAFLKKSK